MFLHAFSGCDTTSSVFNLGKVKFLNTLQKNPDLTASLTIFNEQNVKKQVLASAGERFLIALFGGGQDVKSLDTLRFNCFSKSVNKNKFNLAALPPTSTAAEQHIYRTYLQVQVWHQYDIEATEWGWKKTFHGLDPITSTAQPAPESLLKMISCKCKTNCGKKCGCRKSGLKCSIICQGCCGQTCDNIIELHEVLDYDEDDDITAEEVSRLKMNNSDKIDSTTVNDNVEEPSVKKTRV